MGLEIEDKWAAFVLEIVQFPWPKETKLGNRLLLTTKSEVKFVSLSQIFISNGLKLNC